MRTEKRVVTIALLLGVALLIFGLWLIRFTGQPSYKGKPLGQWLAQVSVGTPIGSDLKEALRDMGPAAAPYVAREIGVSDLPVRLWFQKLVEKQTLIRFKFTTALERRRRAHWVFPEIASVAGATVPVLVEDLRSRNPDVRMRAANCLEWVLARSDGEVAIPALITALGDTDADVRKNAASALRTSRYSLATNAVPELWNLVTNDLDWRVRANGALALGEIRPLSPTTVAVLISALRDEQRNVRHATTLALGKLGSSAKDAEPELRRLITQDDTYVSVGARNALENIRTSAAGKQ